MITRDMFATTAGRVISGQLLAFLMSCTGVFTTLLVNNGASFPLLQSISAYAAIVAVFVPLYAPFYLGTGYERLLSVMTMLGGKGQSHGSPTLRSVNVESEQGNIATPAQQQDPTYNRSTTACSSSSSVPLPTIALPPGGGGGSSSLPSFSNFIVGDRLWRYALIAVADLEANYLVVKAYSYTNMTSVQLLDCFTIPCVMLLSLALLRVVYSRWQVGGVLVAVLGIVLLIVLDADGLTRTSEAPNTSLGDALCLASSACYAISNVLCEMLIKVPPAPTTPHDSHAEHISVADSRRQQQRDGEHAEKDSCSEVSLAIRGGGADDKARLLLLLPPVPAWLPVLEYLAVMPSMALCLGILQFLIFEMRDLRSFVAQGSWSGNCTLYLVLFAQTMVLVYAGMPFIFFISSATFANVSLLTSDIYSIIFNVTLFSTNPKATFFLPYILIVAGIVGYDTNGFENWRQRFFYSSIP